MTAKEYLGQAYRLDQRIDAKIAQVASLNELATKCTATLTGMPRSSSPSGSTMADAVCKIIDLQEEINQDIDRLVDLKRDIVEIIKAVNNSEYQILLEKRYTKLSPNHSGQRTHSIDRITPHCVVGQCSVETLGNVFLPTSRQASSNYGIGVDGRVGMYVEEKNRSWCSSSAANDQRAVTIECASDSKAPYVFKDVVYQRLIELCTDICKRNGKTRLLWLGDKTKTLNYSPKQDEMVLTVHRWFANKSCPGDWLYARMGDLAEKVTAALGGQSPASLDNTPAAWSKDAVNWVLENRLLLGDSNGNLKLRENLTREQFCVMLKRYHDMIQK